MICGGGDTALDWAIHCAEIAASVILIHRRDDFNAVPKSIARMRELCANQQMTLLIGQVTDYKTIDYPLSEITLANIDGDAKQIPLDDLLVFFGLSPKLGPIAAWGLNIDRKQVCVDTEKI